MGYTWQYYDLVLLGVFACLSAGAVMGAFTSISLASAVAGAGLVAALMIGHGLFVNGPVDRPRDLTDEVDALN